MKHVSIIMLACDRPKHLWNTLRSWANINYPDFDFILVDNHSKNPEANSLIAREFKDSLNLSFYEEDTWHNMNVLWNKYGQASKGEYVVFAMQDEIVCRKNVIQRMMEFEESRTSVFTYFMNQAETANIENLNWYEHPDIIPLPRTDQTTAGLISHIHGAYRRYWDWFGWFRNDENGHLWLDQDVHLREVALGNTTKTATEVYCLHQWHPPAIYHNGYTQPGYHYSSELQARLLEPAERDLA